MACPASAVDRSFSSVAYANRVPPASTARGPARWCGQPYQRKQADLTALRAAPADTGSDDLATERGSNVQSSRNARRGLSRDGHAHARHRRRQHGAAADRVRPRRRPLRASVGRGRVHPRAGGRRPHLRLDRRPVRAPARLQPGPRPLHRRVALVRGRRQHRHARRRPRRAGTRGRNPVRHSLALLAEAFPDARERAGALADLRRDDRGLVRGRARRGRCADVGSRLALGVLRERAGRDRRPSPPRTAGCASRSDPKPRRCRLGRARPR